MCEMVGTNGADDTEAKGGIAILPKTSSLEVRGILSKRGNWSKENDLVVGGEGKGGGERVDPSIPDMTATIEKDCDRTMLVLWKGKKRIG